MGRTVHQLSEQLRLLHRQITQLQAQLVHCIDEFDTNQGYELDHYRSAAAWLRGELHLHPREAAHLVGMARQLRHLPGVDAAFTHGVISQAHVAVIARTARQVGVEHVAASENVLLGVAATGSPERLRVATQHLRHCVDPDGMHRDAVKAYERRELSVAPTIYGMVTIQGMLDPTSGATVLAALNALTPPPRDADPRTAGQRRADDGGGLPQVNGEKPHLLVTVPYETLLGELDSRVLVNQLGGTRPIGQLGRESLISQLGPESQVGQLGRGSLVSPPDGSRDPITGHPAVAGPARLAWVGPISATDARMLACDCAIIPAVLNSAGEVLDIGRKSRVWPVAIRRAIELRDQTCRHLDCDTPAEHCDIHHKKPWAQGGDTSHHNGILTCRRHHTELHNYGGTFWADGHFTTMRQ